VKLITKELLKKLYDAGMYALTMQIESGNPQTLAYIDKGVDLNYAKEIVQYAHKLGLTVGTNVIIGFYFETREDIEESIRVAESLGFDSVNYLLAEPSLNTKLYYDCIREGLIQEGVPYTMPFDLLHLKGSELKEIQDKANGNLKVPLKGEVYVLTSDDIRHEIGYCWQISLPLNVSAGSTPEKPFQSQSFVCEDDIKLRGPSNSYHDDIRRFGCGMFSHWGKELYFSSSDNTDPKKNGRSYTFHY